MDPAGEKPVYGYDQDGEAPPPPAYTQQPAAQGYGASAPAGAYPQGGMPPPQPQMGQPPPQQQTVVVINNPQQVVPGMKNWVNGLFGCFNNCNVCILSWFCPCYVVGQNAEALGESFLVYAIGFLFLPYCVQCFVRMKIRGRLQIVGSEVGDCCAVWCCQPCALAQERNEMLNAIQKGEIVPPVMQRM